MKIIGILQACIRRHTSLDSPKARRFAQEQRNAFVLQLWAIAGASSVTGPICLHLLIMWDARMAVKPCASCIHTAGAHAKRAGIVHDREEKQSGDDVSDHQALTGGVSAGCPAVDPDSGDDE